MHKLLTVLFAILAIYATNIQATGGCQPSCARTIPENLSSREDVVQKVGSCSGGCDNHQPCDGSVNCIYNPRTGNLQGISSTCRCGVIRTPAPSQAVRALTMDLAQAQKKEIRDDVWQKRYLEDAVNREVVSSN